MRDQQDHEHLVDERRRTTLTDDDLDHIVKHVNKVGVRLSGEDIDRLAEAMESRIMKRFYLNVGKGVLGLAWKGILILLLVIAAYGHYFKGFTKP